MNSIESNLINGYTTNQKKNIKEMREENFFFNNVVGEHLSSMQNETNNKLSSRYQFTHWRRSTHKQHTNFTQS
jgi:hypothetical protein